MQFPSQWLSVRTSQSTTTHSAASPSHSCNLHAAIFSDQFSFGVGLCMRDSNGSFQKAKTTFFNGISTPAEVEAFALQKSIEWVQSLNIDNVIFETDCKMITDHFGLCWKWPFIFPFNFG
ncbi:hypothetical protein GmHk_11G033296 [Glycine max]|nr:hypothetical protein JHK87_032102 [Glycine soja]KAH1226695.1 hypothetical protein GmHk_11G033296 [Glycine max]